MRNLQLMLARLAFDPATRRPWVADSTAFRDVVWGGASQQQLQNLHPISVQPPELDIARRGMWQQIPSAWRQQVPAVHRQCLEQQPDAEVPSQDAVVHMLLCRLGWRVQHHGSTRTLPLLSTHSVKDLTHMLMQPVSAQVLQQHLGDVYKRLRRLWRLR